MSSQPIMDTEREPCKPRRILLAVHSLSAGGAQRVVSEMANWWATHGREVGVLTLEPRDHDLFRLHTSVKRITFNRQIPRTRLHIPAQFVRDLSLIRAAAFSYKPELAISYMDRTNIHMLLAFAATRIPLIVSERTDPRHHRIGFPWSLARRLLYPFASSLVVQTDSVTAWAGRVVPGSRVRVIPNFVREMPETGAPAGEGDDSHRYILSVGRLSKEKGHDVLIRAFALAKAKHKGWRLVILGEGSERANLEGLAADLGISEAVVMPGTEKEPAFWLHKAGFFVLPSRYEGFPNALLEAMACGCAVISADCPSGPADIVRNGENGLLVPRDDVPAMSAAMGRLMEDEGLRTRLGGGALEVCSRFSRERIMAQWDALIESVCP
jgi:GalNAc-alpha-(1->4)-GalNAc-alpha-(1->3)-diNAcBac-PP-undecaprenol alpha-1,4-N-acetyl-D-galactosaminyltransferase